MALRTTSADVLAIMDTNLTESQVNPFLTMANLMVDNKLLSAGLSSATLVQVEKFLAAHFACIISPYAIEETIGPAKDKTGYKGGEGLKATPYGETAMMLDTSGSLSRSYMKTCEFGIIEFDIDGVPTTTSTTTTVSSSSGGSSTVGDSSSSVTILDSQILDSSYVIPDGAVMGG